MSLSGRQIEGYCWWQRTYYGDSRYSYFHRPLLRMWVVVVVVGLLDCSMECPFCVPPPPYYLDRPLLLRLLLLQGSGD